MIRPWPRFVLFAQQTDDHRLEGVAVRIDPITEFRADGHLGLGEDGGRSDQAEVHFGGARAITDLKVTALFELPADAFFDLAFANTAQTVDAAFAQR